MDALQADDGVTSDVLHFEFQWSESELAPLSVSRTLGSLELRLGDHVVWPAEGGFEWAWIDLLEWLALSWIRLSHEDGLPFRTDPGTVQDLLTHVERESRYSPEGTASELEIRLWQFLEAHDLSRSLDGAMLPSVIIWKEGLIGHALTDDIHVRTNWASLRANLADLGDYIAGRLAETELDPRAASALHRWETRNVVGVEELVAVASDLDGERLAPVLRLLAKRDGLQELLASGLDEDEVLAAARMTSGLSADLIQSVMSHVDQVEKGDASLVEREADLIIREADLSNGKPFEQGHALGASLRSHLGIEAHERFNPQEWLEQHGVVLQTIRVDTSAIDAIACWGTKAGPAVLVNSKGKHSKSRNGRNATVAHEICHLLVDRRGALPAVEVLGGRVNPAIEARARAFAAEALLPREHAGRVLAAAADASEAKKAVAHLGRSHRVSQELVAWQARNSDFPLTAGVIEYLRKLVASPWLF